MKKIDEYCMASGITTFAMMEQAGYQTAFFCKKIIKKEDIVLVLAGQGNNGGDGLVAARHLANWEYKVIVLTAVSKSKFKDLSKIQLYIIQKMMLPIYVFKNNKKIHNLIESSNLIIDALLGFSLKGNPRNSYKKLIERINLADKKVLALDIPSGLDSTDGKVYYPCIKADYTLTLGLPKKSFQINSTKKYLGQLYLADIGIPKYIYNRFNIKVGGIFKNSPIIKIT